MKTIYMDNNATTQIAEEVLEAMLPYLKEYYGNASSMHIFGGRLRHKIDRARQQVADLLGCDSDEIIFTGSVIRCAVSPAAEPVREALLAVIATALAEDRRAYYREILKSYLLNLNLRNRYLRNCQDHSVRVGVA